jgi:hypothetical protein
MSARMDSEPYLGIPDFMRPVTLLDLFQIDRKWPFPFSENLEHLGNDDRTDCIGI